MKLPLKQGNTDPQLIFDDDDKAVAFVSREHRAALRIIEAMNEREAMREVVEAAREYVAEMSEPKPAFIVRQTLLKRARAALARLDAQKEG